MLEAIPHKCPDQEEQEEEYDQEDCELGPVRHFKGPETNFRDH